MRTNLPQQLEQFVQTFVVTNVTKKKSKTIIYDCQNILIVFTAIGKLVYQYLML